MFTLTWQGLSVMLPPLMAEAMTTEIVNSLAALMPYQVVRDGIVLFLGLVLAISLHEFGHAAAAVWLGDPTPRRGQSVLGGRVSDLGALLGVRRGIEDRYTLNPLAHADPIGTVVLPLMGLFLMPSAMLFGWGRPVPFDPYAARARVSRQRMIVLVSLAGPAMNVAQFLAYSVLLVLLLASGLHTSHVELVAASVRWVQLLVGLNLILAAFNLLPVPPLDGGHILVQYLKRTNPQAATWLTQYGLLVLVFALMVLPALLSPVAAFSRMWTDWMALLAGVDPTKLPG